MAAKETTVCVKPMQLRDNKPMQLRDNKPMCAFISDKLEVFFPLSLSINPFHPNISKHILPTLFYTFPLVLTRRIF